MSTPESSIEQLEIQSNPGKVLSGILKFFILFKLVVYLEKC